MSFQAMTWAVKQDLPCQQKMVLLMLANRTNHDTGRCDPSMTALAKECGLSVRAVQNALKALQEAGFLEVVRRRIGSVNLPNAYRLNWGCDVAPDVVLGDFPEGDLGGGACGAPLVQEVAGGGACGAPLVQEVAGGGACGAPGGARRAPEPVIQPYNSLSLRSRESGRAQTVEPEINTARPRRSQTGTRLPDDWEPSDEDVAFARRERPDVDWRAEAEGFRDYWHAKAGAGARKVDWSATWRNWIRRADGMRKPAPARQQAPAAPGKTMQALMALEAMKHGNELDSERDFAGVPAAGLLGS